MKKKLLILTTIFVLFIVNSVQCQELDSKHSNKIPTKMIFSQSIPDKGNLVLGVYEDSVLGDQGKRIDEKSDGGLSHAMKMTNFNAKIKTSQLITGPRGSGFSQILLVGMGSSKSDTKTTNTELQWQEIGGYSVQEAVKAFTSEANHKASYAMAFDLKGDLNSHENLANLAYGAKLGSYFFDNYYTIKKRQKYQQSITLLTNEATEFKSYYESEYDPIANAIWYTRDVSNEPANVIYPQSFVDQWKQHFKSVKGVKITVLDEKDMLEKNMGAIYGVGRGSAKGPRIMIVEYMAGAKDDAPVVIVGKGITFDTGGISIKGSKNMWDMKFDMSGAASTMGTIYALAGTKAKVNVVGIAALAENMPGGNAQRPGDVVTSMSGKTIQIRSTDAEGRLVLADGIYYGDVTYNPALLVDLATLTGSASRALGKDYAALFTRHDKLVQPFLSMGKQTGDEVWQLPLNENHFKAIENNVADVMNSGPDAPGASAGAAFVGTFVRESTPWVHLDIAGVAWNDKTLPTKSSPGSTSFGIRLLNGYIRKHHEK